MNKTEFLLTLQKQLSLLEDDEQADIIDEYSQHIEMKVKSGMTEEEAIADFGPIDQLISEILGAYHVKAPAKAVATQGIEESASVKSSAFDAGKIAEGGKKAAAGAANAAKGCFSKLDAVGKDITRKRAEKKAQRPEEDSQDAASTDKKTSKGVAAKTGECARNVAGGIARGTSQVGAGTLSLSKNLLRWFWNLCVACVVAAFLLCTIAFLVTFGFSIVLSMQGYPVFGICLASLGLLLAFLSLSLLSLRLIVRKSKEAKEERAHTEAAPNKHPGSANAPSFSAGLATDEASVGDFPASASASESTAPIHPAQGTQGDSTEPLPRVH